MSVLRGVAMAGVHTTTTVANQIPDITNAKKQVAAECEIICCIQYHLQGTTVARAKITAEKVILHMYEKDMCAYMYARSRARASASERQAK